MSFFSIKGVGKDGGRLPFIVNMHPCLLVTMKIVACNSGITVGKLSTCVLAVLLTIIWSQGLVMVVRVMVINPTN